MSYRVLFAAVALPFACCFAADAPADFQWQGLIAASQTVEIRLIDGSIRFEQSPDNLTYVTAWKAGTRPDPADIRIEAEPYDGGLLVCALWPSPRADRPNQCALKNAQNQVNLDNPDTKVTFLVRVPGGVKLRGSLINGSMSASLGNNPVNADLINGPISVATTGPVQAHVINGNIVASLGKGSGANELQLINGTIQVTLDSAPDTAISAETIAGSIRSDFPLDIRQMIVGSRAQGVLGAGTGKMAISVINGWIALRRAPDPTEQP